MSEAGESLSSAESGERSEVETLVWVVVRRTRLLLLLANLPLGLLGLINTQYETQVLLFKALYGLF